MKFYGVKLLMAGASLALASYAAHADLVWTKGKGWQVEGGVLAKVIGESAGVDNALQAMNEAKNAQEAGDNWTAISYYKIVADEYPNSVFAPEAYYQLGILYRDQHMFSDSYRCFENLIKNYPDFGKFNLVIGQEYKLANEMQAGARPYLWGWLPWVRNHNNTIKYYESVISNAPFSDYAPMSLMNIAILADSIDKPEIAIDALDRLINTYPQSIFTPDAYLQMAKTYRNMVEGPEYDQTSVVKAMDFYQDFLILFPKDASAANAEEGFELMQDIHARSRLIIGDFYYKYRDNFRAATIFYNETITLAPNSLAAQEARERLKDIADGVKAMMTPADWFLGRYEKPEYDQEQDAARLEALQNEMFRVRTAEDFMTLPGAESYEEFEPDGKVKEFEGFAPLFGPELDDMFDFGGTLEDGADDE